MFWSAFHRGTLTDARKMATVLARIARERRSLWGLARATNANAHINLRASQLHDTVSARAVELRSRAHAAFTRTADLAFRLDRLDAHRDAIRLAIWTSDEPRERHHLITVVTRWLDDNEPTIESASALYDLAAWACQAGDAAAATNYARRLERIATRLDNSDARDMVTVADFAARATTSPEGLTTLVDATLSRLNAPGSTSSIANRDQFAQRVRQLAEVTALRTNPRHLKVPRRVDMIVRWAPRQDPRRAGGLTFGRPNTGGGRQARPQQADFDRWSSL